METDKDIRITAEVPGMDARHFRHDHRPVVTIKGEKKEEKMKRRTVTPTGTFIW